MPLLGNPTRKRGLRRIFLAYASGYQVFKQRHFVPAARGESAAVDEFWRGRFLMPRDIAILLIAGLLVASGCDRQTKSMGRTSGEVEKSLNSGPDRDVGIDGAGIGKFKDAVHMSDEAIEKLLSSGDAKQAYKSAQARLLLDPNDAESIFWMARALAAQNRFSEAIRLLDDIPESNTEANVAAMGQAAEWHELTGDWDLAVIGYRKLLEAAPEADFVRRRLARILNRQGHRLEAATQLRTLCRNGNIEEEELCSLLTLSYAFAGEKTSDFSPLGVLGDARVVASNRDYAAAAGLLEPHVADGDPSIYALYGRMLILQQNTDLTRQWETSAMQGANQHADYWLAKGTLALLDGKFSQAIVSLAEAILLDPTDKFAYIKYSEALSRVGQAEAAKLAFERSELARKTAIIGNDFANDRRDEKRIRELCGLLKEMGRPFEVLSWEGVAIAYSQEKRSQDDANKIISRLNQERLKQLEVDAEVPERTLLCGFSLKDLKDRFGSDQTSMAGSLPSVSPVAMLNPAVIATFNDIAGQVGLTHQYDFTNVSVPESSSLAQEVGGGVAVIDYNLDGLPDMYFPQACATPMKNDGAKPNALFCNHGNSFSNVLLESGSDDRGFGQGATAGDINQDGFPDLVVANIGSNRLFINNGDGTFQSEALESRSRSSDSSPVQPYWTSSLAIGDISGDSLPDIVEVNYIDDALAFETHYSPPTYKHALDRIFVNDGHGYFLTVPLGENPFDGLAVLLTDLDGDRVNDIYVANDGKPNQYWQRRSSGNDGLFQLGTTRIPMTAIAGDDGFELVECARAKGCAVNSDGAIVASMGISTGDFNVDGASDLFITDFYAEPSVFFLQTPDHNFVDAASRFGIYEPSFKTLGFGTQAIDVDLDSRLDIAVVNGHVLKQKDPKIPFEMPPQLYRFQGDGRIAVDDVVDDSGYWTKPVLARGLAVMDWNQDGRNDLVAVHLDVPVALVENRTDHNYGWLQVRLIGTQSERDAVGARVVVTTEASIQVMTVNSGDGYCCKNEMLLTFGLNVAKSADVRVEWPSGLTTNFKATELRKRLLVVEGEDQPYIEPTSLRDREVQ